MRRMADLLKRGRFADEIMTFEAGARLDAPVTVIGRPIAVMNSKQ